MSGVSFELQAKLRSQNGKAAARRLRRDDRVPAIIYGANKPPQVIELDHREIMQALSHEAFFSHILTLNLEGQSPQKVILKHLQRHPYKPRIQHVDFLRIKAKEKIVMMVPIHFMGEEEAPGIEAGGVFSKLMNDVEVRCLPADLPEYIEVDVSKLNLHESVHLSEIKLPKGVELAIGEVDEEHDQAIINIHEPRVSEEKLEEELEAEAEAAKEAEGETEAEAEDDDESESKEEESSEQTKADTEDQNENNKAEKSKDSQTDQKEQAK